MKKYFVLSALVLGIAGYAFFNMGDKSVPNHSDPNIHENASHVETSHQSHDHSSHTPNQQKVVDTKDIEPPKDLSAKSIRTALKMLNAGQTPQKNSSLKGFLQKAQEQPQEIVNILGAELDRLEYHQVNQRNQLFGLLIEVGAYMPAHSQAAEQFAEAVAPIVKKEVSLPEEMAISSSGYSTDEIEEMLHHGPYNEVDGQIYLRTFENKFMALSILKETKSDISKNTLQDISDDLGSSSDPIREVANHIAAESNI